MRYVFSVYAETHGNEAGVFCLRNWNLLSLVDASAAQRHVEFNERIRSVINFHIHDVKPEMKKVIKKVDKNVA